MATPIDSQPGNPSSPPPAPPPAAVPPSTPAPAGVSGSASGPGSSGASGLPAAVPAPAAGVSAPAPTPGFSAAASPATQGVNPGQPAPGAAADPRIAAYEQQLAQLNQQVQHYRQYEHLIPLGYAQYQQQLQGPKPAAPAPAAPENPFGLPAFDHRLLEFVARDPATGRLVLEPGAPPDALIRVQEYQDKLRGVQQEFWSDPMKFLGAEMEKRIDERAKKLIAEQLGGYQQQTAAEQIMAGHDSWLYARDAQGNKQTRFDPASGQHRPVLSPWGQAYAQAAAEAERLGITDPRRQDQYATQKVQNLAFQARYAQDEAARTGQAAGQQFVNAAAAALPAPAQPAPSYNPAPQPVEGMNFREVMRQRFAQAGLTDAALAQQLGGAA